MSLERPVPSWEKRDPEEELYEEEDWDDEDS